MCTAYDSSTLWLLNIAMANGPFIDRLSTKKIGSFHGYVKYQMVFVNGWLLKGWLAVSFGLVSANFRFGRK